MKKIAFLIGTISFVWGLSQKEKIEIPEKFKTLPEKKIPKFSIPTDTLTLDGQKKIMILPDSLLQNNMKFNKNSMPVAEVKNPELYTGLVRKEDGNTLPILNTYPTPIEQTPKLPTTYEKYRIEKMEDNK